MWKNQRLACSIQTGLIVARLALASIADAHEACEGDKSAPSRPPSSAELAGLGSVHFPVQCKPAARQDFERGVAMLHSFWYDSAAAAFNAALAADPECAMAHWGLAMSYYHPLWAAPDNDALSKGERAVLRARALGGKTPEERDFIEAIAEFYRNSSTTPHTVRVHAYKRAMAQLYRRHPENVEVAAFYALILFSDAAPGDKALTDQRRAGQIAEKIFMQQPNHPGAAHYIIHAYDYPSLATRALPAARAYAKIAPASAHALHMPSHTFTQLGLWRESIASNIASEKAAKAHAAEAHMAGAWEEQLHALDYLEYAYLQLGMDGEAAGIATQAAGIQATTPARSRKAAYALEAIPARYAIERRRWQEAATLQQKTQDFPRAASVTYFARAYARARLKDLTGAREDLRLLSDAAARLAQHSEEGANASALVRVQQLVVEGWLAHAEGRSDEALHLLRVAANLEDSTDDGPTTPGPLIRAREVLGELLLELARPVEARKEFESALKSSPERFNAKVGLARAAQLEGDEHAKELADGIDALCEHANCDRPVLAALRLAERKP